MYIHNLDPVLLDFGFIAIRWYSLAYIFGIVIGWWLGKKIELKVTEKGSNELDQRVHEITEKWNQMQALYKSGDKKKLQGFMDDNRSFFPMMMFFGVMDIMMFSMMFSMIGASMGDYVPAESMPDGADGAMDDGGMDGGGMDDGGFDIDIGF